jgi:tetratricopeptide (TPR) repeat protein
MEEALKLYNAGKLESAAHLCAQIVAGRPKMPTAHNLMGLIFHSQGKAKESVKSLRRAANLAPKNARYLANLGEIERRRGKLPEALAVLTEAVSINPKLSQAHNNLGIVHFDRGEFERAIECYEKATKNGKRFPEAHNNMGNALRALGRSDEAIEQYRKALSLRKDYAEAYNSLASVLRKKGLTAEAEHNYREAIRCKPEQLEVYDNLAGLLAENDRKSDALKVLRECLQIDARHVPALLQVARIQFSLSNYRRAEHVCRLVLLADPASAEGFSLLGQIQRSTDRVAEAIKSFEKALELRPGLLQAKNHLGICLKSLRRLEEARAR